MKAYFNLNVAEANTLFSLSNTSISNFDEGEDAIMSILKNESNQLSVRYHNAATFNQPLSETKSIDNKRNILTRCSFYFLRGYAEHPDETKNQAANDVLDRLRGKNYSEIINLPYASKSLELEEIFRILDEPAVSPLVDILVEFKLSINALKETEEEFNEVALKEELKKSENIHQENASDLRPIAIDFVNNKLLRYVYLMEEMNPEVYGELARVLREIVKSVNQRLKTRQTLREKAEKDKKEENDSETPKEKTDGENTPEVETSEGQTQEEETQGTDTPEDITPEA